MNTTLTQRQDVWGNALLRSPDGPTYEGVRSYLHPLMLVGRPAGIRPGRLTDSGVYYLPFGRPAGADGAKAVQLHVADGSQIVSEMANGSRLSIDVGVRGRERYGSCLARLAAPRLRGGYLPILETEYVDADGVRYQQESFATRLPRTGALISFVRLHVDPRGSAAGKTLVRFTPSGGLDRRARARLLSRGGKRSRSSVVYSIRGKRPRTVYVAWLDRPASPRPSAPGRIAYKRARRKVIAYWSRRLAAAATFVVPRETRARRRAQPPDPEHADVLALQPRELLRTVLVGARRRRGGDGRLRLPPDRARDPRGVASLEQLLPEPGGRRADGCVRPLLPPLPRPQVHQARHACVPEEPRRLRPAARSEPARNPGQGALRRRHRLPDLRPARPGARAAGPARHVGDMGADAGIRSSPPSPPGWPTS